MDEAWTEGIKSAIAEAGYDPFRIDRKEHNNRIVDEIISEIRRSRLLVADFSHGEDVARGGSIKKLVLPMALAFRSSLPAGRKIWMITILTLGNTITLFGKRRMISGPNYSTE